MIVNNKIQEPRTLKDYTRLVISFWICLVFLAFYQQTRLYFNGAIDTILSKSILLLILNHIGFTALLSLLVVFLFKILERFKPGIGFKLTIIILSTILLSEALLVEYYIRNYELLGRDIFALQANSNLSIVALLGSIALLLLVTITFFIGYKTTKNFYNMVGKMYPFTIILFTLFLSTLLSEKQPINQNKTQYLVYETLDDIFDFNEYQGEKEYPLLVNAGFNTQLSNYFNLKTEKPNIVFIVVEGLGSDFINTNGKYKGFTPFLDTLTKESLFWENYMSNSGESSVSISSIVGSLPFGKTGFTNTKKAVFRNTLFSILKSNGYRTSFNYGGNSSLDGIDRFFDEERIDELMDKSQFGKDYQLQAEDKAGISLGYPDKELYKKWAERHTSIKKPKLEFFLTLSAKSPYAIPNKPEYLKQVEEIADKSIHTKRNKKLILKNMDAFAAMLYSDEALKSLFSTFQSTKEYQNTIYIITGANNMETLPKDNNLEKYRVPLIMYSPLLKKSQRFTQIASHLDIAPSVLSLLYKQYNIKLPVKTAWLGKDLLNDTNKEIPLFRKKNSIREYIYENNLYSNGNVYTLEEELKPVKVKNKRLKKKLAAKYRYFKSINKYITENNKLIPDSIAIYDIGKQEFTKQELVWLDNVFNGKNYDKAYEKAKSLAHNGKTDRALLLSNYILSMVPAHIDALILKGRVFAWKKEYNKAQDILEMAVRKFPKYHDAYAALLDVYYWSNNDILAQNVYLKIKDNNIENEELKKKVERCIARIGSKIDTTQNFATIQFNDN